MRLITLVAVIISHLIGASVALAIIRFYQYDNPEIAIYVGAGLGSQLGAMIHHRQHGATNSVGVKASIGGVLVFTSIAFILVAQYLTAAFKYLDITISIAAIGSFGFPFVLFDTMWKTLSKNKEQEKKEQNTK